MTHQSARPLRARAACHASIVIAALAVSLPGHAASVLSAEQATEEVEFAYATIVETHPDPFWRHDRDQWEHYLDQLRRRSGEVTETEQYFALAALFSLATDTHVQIYPKADAAGFENSYPIRLRLFDEGVFVTAGHGYTEDWVGAHVVAVGGTPMADVIDVLARHAFSDHAARKRSWAVEHLLPHPATYRQFGWMTDEAVPLTIEDRAGELRPVTLRGTIDVGFDAVLSSGTAAAYYWPAGWRTLDDLIPGDPPLSRAHLDRNYWYTDLAADDAVYVQLNAPFDQEGRETLLQFQLRLFGDLTSRARLPEKIIIDLRYDLGGSIDLSLPLAYLVSATRMCCTPGRIIVLTGPDTVSAGSVLVGALEDTARAVVVGRRTGSRPNIFLGHRPFELPYSRLAPEVSSAVFYSTDSSDDRLFVAPDVEVPERFAELMAGRDAALEAALALTRDEASGFFTPATRLKPWLRTSQQAARPPDR